MELAKLRNKVWFTKVSAQDNWTKDYYEIAFVACEKPNFLKGRKTIVDTLTDADFTLKTPVFEFKEVESKEVLNRYKFAFSECRQGNSYIYIDVYVKH